MVANKWYIGLGSLVMVGISAGIITGLAMSGGLGQDKQSDRYEGSVGANQMPVPNFPGGNVDELIVNDDSGMPVPSANGLVGPVADTEVVGEFQMPVPTFPEGEVDEMIVLD